MTEQAQAHVAFLQGTLHPICPRCGSGDLRVNRKKTIDGKGDHWRTYRCDNCDEKFKATVEAPR